MITTRAGVSGSQVRIDGEFTIYQAAEGKAALLAALAAHADVEVDLGGVAEMDSAGLQVLLLAKREALARGKHLRLVRHSAASLAVIDTYGLAAYFGDPLVVAESGAHA